MGRRGLGRVGGLSGGPEWVGEVKDGLEDNREVRDRSRDTRGGPGRVEGP